MKILYDGWPLVYAANSPAALHLAALLAHIPPGVYAALALPGASRFSLPAGVEALVDPAPNTAAGRLGWEQRRLPRLAKNWGASALHLTASAAPLFANLRSLVSPASSDLFEGGAHSQEATPPAPRSLAGRLRDSLLQGGLGRGGTFLWPEDLPLPASSDLNPASFIRLPPVPPPGFTGEAREQHGEAWDAAPEAYALVHTSQAADLHQALVAWGWASPALGEGIFLVVVGLDAPGRSLLESLIQQAGLSDTVLAAPELSVAGLAALYRNALAVLHPGRLTPWANPLRLGLFSGRPLVAVESAWADAIVGPAAYLVPPDPATLARSLGAALISLLVEDELAQSLAQAAQQRAAGWDSQRFSAALWQAYRQ